MATDPTTITTPEQRRTRRNLLAAGLGALGAAAAASIARISPVSASDGQFVRVGFGHSGEQTTSFRTQDVAAVMGTSTTAGGLNGTSEQGQGVHGQSTSAAGVRGVSESGPGVHGGSTSSRGVWGQSESGPGVEGRGAVGVNAIGPVAVRATSDDGYAVETSGGRVRLGDLSGIATIKKNQTEVRIKPKVTVTPDTYVLLTPQSDPGNTGYWFSKAPEKNEIIIRMRPARNKETKFAYVILEHVA